MTVGAPWPEAAFVARGGGFAAARPATGGRAADRHARGARPARLPRAVWATRPWWSRLTAGSAVPPPGVVPAVTLLGVGACVAPGAPWRLLGAGVALVAGTCWLLAATAWVRISRVGVLWRHLGRVRRLRWSEIAGCATVWVEQGRKQVRVVGFETRDGRLELLWPTAWVGEGNRRALVAMCGRYRFGRATGSAPH